MARVGHLGLAGVTEHQERGAQDRPTGRRRGREARRFHHVSRMVREGAWVKVGKMERVDRGPDEEEKRGAWAYEEPEGEASVRLQGMGMLGEARAPKQEIAGIVTAGVDHPKLPVRRLP